MVTWRFVLVALWLCMATGPALAQENPVAETAEGVTVRMTDVDLRTAVQLLARYLDHPVVFGDLTPRLVTIETPRPVAREDVPQLLSTLLASNGYELRLEGDVYVVTPLPGLTQPALGLDGEEATQLSVIRLQHAQALEVAGTVSALYGQASAFGELGAPLPTLNQSLRDLQQAGATVEGGVGQSRGTVGFSGLVTIVPDPRTNSLLVRSNPRDFSLIEAAVQQIDVRPLQVLIEVLIAEVRKDRSLAFGLDAILPPTHVAGTTDTRMSAENRGLGLADFVLRILDIGGADLDLVFSAAAARGDVSIASRPIVFATNNETAEIMVGSQRPFVQIQRTLPTDAGARDQVVQYRDVGTRLSVRPTISDEGYVALEVVQEVNAATSEIAFEAPVISTRTVQTKLLVRDGHTAVLGGLTDHQEDLTQSGVPLLSHIPLVGGLFGRSSKRSFETELFVFITPRVIRNDDDLASVVGEIRTGEGGVPEGGFEPLR